MRNPCAFTLSLSLALVLASIGFLGMPLAAQAALYLPGATLDPSCAPTDPNCGISTIVASSSANNVPYYANNGSTLSSTSSIQILPNGTASTTNLIVGNSLTLGTLSGFIKAIAGAIATSLINLASDVTGILSPSNGGTGTSTAPTYGQVLVGNSNGTYTLTATSSLGTGTVTSVAVSGGTTGLTTSGGPITGSGTITIAGTLAVANGGTGLSSGYNNTNWDTAYGWGNHATAGYFPSASFNSSFDTRLTSTTTLPRLTTLAGLAITKSQVSDFGTYQSSLGSGTPGQVLAYLNGTPSWTATTTYSTGLAYANGAVTNTGVISNAGDWAGTWQTFAPSHFLTSLSGAASSTLLADSNKFSGINTFTNPIISTITTGTAPIILASATKVANLNADLLDGFDSSAFGDATAANQTTILTRIGTNADATTTPAAAASLWAAIKYIAGNMKTNATAMSAQSAFVYTHANAAVYCYGLSAAAEVAMDGNTTTVYTDWRLPTVGEASVFEGTITSVAYIWTATVRDATASSWISLRLSDGTWYSDGYTGSYYVRCVR